MPGMRGTRGMFTSILGTLLEDSGECYYFIVILKIPDCPSDIQVIHVEINLKKQKWLVIAIYTLPSQCKNYFITKLTKMLDKCRGSYMKTPQS